MLKYLVALIAVLILSSSAIAQSSKPAASAPKCGPAQPGTIYQKVLRRSQPAGPRSEAGTDRRVVGTHRLDAYTTCRL